MKKQGIRKTIVSFVLLIALLTVQVMQVAAETNNTDTPSVVCSTFSSLYQALIQANDGDVIGIDDAIIMNTSIEFTLGYEDKHVTLVRMNADAHFEVRADQKSAIQNITFDGNGIQGNQPMCIVYSRTEFDDVEFLDCQTNADGGAVQVYVGNVNMNRCIFKGNSAKNGGHIAVFNGSVLNLTECSLTEGHATEYGGAIYYDCSASQYGEVASSLIHGNSADVSGGGIYVASGNLVINTTSKLYGNTAPKGEDMTVLVTGNGSYSTPPDSMFEGENIKINGWNWTEDPDTATKYYKLNYEEIVEPSPTPDPGETEPSEPGDSGSGDDSGNTGDSGKEDPSKPSQTDPGDSSGDQDGTDDKKDDGSGSTEQPATGSNATTTDNSSHDSTTTTDNSSHDTSTITTDNRQTTSTTDNSDHSRTESSDNHSSATYNYYQNQQQQTPVQQPQMQSGKTTEPVVINNYIQPSEQGLTGSQEHQEAVQAESQTVVVPDTGNNIRIDAKGADVTFEVKDGVYSISINASEPVQEADSSVNWYEVIKIVLLAILVINMLWKPRQKDLP